MSDRAVFMGSPSYAVPALRATVDLVGREVLVLTRPDAPRGRGGRIRPTPVREEAERLGLPVITPTRIGPRTLARLDAWGARWALTAAYGLILPPAALARFPRGAYNLHASLLPRWRGPNPIRWAIRAGDACAGVSLMRMDEGVDTGPVLAVRRVAIQPDDTEGTLSARLAEAAAALWTESFAAIMAGRLTESVQVGDATYAPKDDRTDGRIDWSRPAPEVARWIRSMLPDPGPHTMAGNVRLKVLAAVPAMAPGQGEPGEISRPAGRGEEWVVTCGRETAVRIRAVQPAGRRAMSPAAFDRGQSPPPRMLR